VRIGIFDPYLDDLGGGEKYMLTIAEYLSRKNKVDIFWDDKEDLVKLKERFSLDISGLNLVKNIFSPNASLLKKLFETKKYDAIIFLSDGSIPLVLSKKLFIHIQQPLGKMQTGTFINNLKLMRVNKFFSNSEYTKSFIDKKFAIKTMVLYPPVVFRPKKINKENIILHVGRFRVRNVESVDYKKQAVMIKVFKEMVDKGLKDWKFILAVSVQDKDIEAFERMRKNTEKYHIEFLVNKNNDELWNIYSKAKIYWHASGFGEDLNKNPEFAEHFGISTVEAMCAGVVPVVINAGGQKEIVEEGENGLLWNTLDELESKTLKLINDNSLLAKYSEKAKEAAKKFSIERFYMDIDKIMSQ
jgi:glycosyltransferase involved in cell wall biosynthesis